MELKKYNIYVYRINKIRRRLSILDPSNVFERKEMSRLYFEIVSLKEEISKDGERKPYLSVLK
jgi:hypothetical protein